MFQGREGSLRQGRALPALRSWPLWRQQKVHTVSEIAQDRRQEVTRKGLPGTSAGSRQPSKAWSHTHNRVTVTNKQGHTKETGSDGCGGCGDISILLYC